MTRIVLSSKVCASASSASSDVITNNMGCMTWDQVDQSLEREIATQQCALQLKTAERRLFSFIGVYHFLFETLTAMETVDETKKKHWCPKSAIYFLAGLANVINKFRKHVYELKEQVNQLDFEKDELSQNESGILAARHSELIDPDKKIWTKLHDKSLVPGNVEAAYEKVKNLLPGDTIMEYKLRTDNVESKKETLYTVKYNQRQQNNQQEKDMINSKMLKKMSSRKFYDLYVRSDEVVPPSNRISKMFSESFDGFPGMCFSSIRVPRRLDRFLNGEIENLLKIGNFYTSNYVKGMIFTYMVTKLFGASFAGVQLYLKGFSNAAVVATHGPSTSFSKVKLALKKPINSCANGERFTAYFPTRYLHCKRSHEIIQKTTRDIIAEASTFITGRNQKTSIGFLKSPIAEHSSRGFLAQWLAMSVSKILGRPVNVHYALLFLVNWAARLKADSTHYDTVRFRRKKIDDQSDVIEPLRRIAATLGVTFHEPSGLVLPSITFGSGMTKQKLKNYADRIVRNMIIPLVRNSKISYSPPDIAELITKENRHRDDLLVLISNHF